MFLGDERVQQKVAAALPRVLICDPKRDSARLLADLLRDALQCEVRIASTVSHATLVATTLSPALILVEHAQAGFDGIAFTCSLRRGDLPCRKAPVIMATAEATVATINDARNAGIHEFLRKPYTVRELQRRLEVIVLRPRDWVEGIDYVGPDRRRFNTAEHFGLSKRTTDRGDPSNAERLRQAFEIIESAIATGEGLTGQTLRALHAQALSLAAIATSPEIALKAAELARCCERQAAGVGSAGSALMQQARDLAALQPRAAAA